MGTFGEKTREARLRWYGHLRRKDDGYIGRRMLRMELPGKRKRGRPKRRFMDVAKEDMAEVEVTEEDTVFFFFFFFNKIAIQGTPQMAAD